MLKPLLICFGTGSFINTLGQSPFFRLALEEPLTARRDQDLSRTGLQGRQSMRPSDKVVIPDRTDC